MPGLFAAVRIPSGPHAPGGPYSDGGQFDRVGLLPWRRSQAQSLYPSLHQSLDQSLVPALVHLVQKSLLLSGADAYAASEPGALVVVSPRSGKGLASLGDFEGDMRAARERGREGIRAGSGRLLVHGIAQHARAARAAV